MPGRISRMVPRMWLMPRGRARAESFWNRATLTAIVGSIAWVIGKGLALSVCSLIKAFAGYNIKREHHGIGRSPPTPARFKKDRCAAKQKTLNHWVGGSIPTRCMPHYRRFKYGLLGATVCFLSHFIEFRGYAIPGLSLPYRSIRLWLLLGHAFATSLS